MIHNFVEFITLVDALINIKNNSNMLTVLIISLCIVCYLFLKFKKGSNEIDDKDLYHLFGEKYMTMFEKPRLRENDFYAKTGIRAHDKDICRYLYLKQLLNYKQWYLLRLAQSRIRFEGNNFTVKWGLLDQIVLCVLTLVTLFFICVFVWFLIVFIPFTVHLIVFENVEVTGLNLLLFLFIATISLMSFFLWNIREPFASYLVRRDYEKINRTI